MILPRVAGASRGRLQGREALEREPPEHDRPRGQALSQGSRHGGEALLHRPRPDGEPLGADRRYPAHGGEWSCRADCGPRDDRGAGRSAARHHPRHGQGYDAEDFVNELRSMHVRPHVAQNTNGRRSAIDRRTTRHAGYGRSQRIRKRIEEAFGWIKTVAGQRRTKFRGRDRVGWAFAFAAAAYNLVRLPKLIAGAVS